MSIIYNIVFHIKTSQRLSPDEIKFLSLLLLNSKFTDNFNLNRSLIDLSFITRVKKRFSGDKTNSEMLVFYTSPIPITRIQSDLIEILDSAQDKTEYDKLNQDEQFIIIGNLKAKRLLSGESKYINKIIASSPFVSNNQLKSNKSSSKPCNHYKTFYNVRKT
jgi:hypothetical protein